MALVTTTNLSLKTFADGDNPGAGSQTTSSGNTGLNANALIIDTALGTFHNADGSHKANAVTGSCLAASIVDNSSLQLSSNQLSIKALGVLTSHIALLNITNALIANQTILPAKMDSNAATSGYPLIAGATTPSYAQLTATGIAANTITGSLVSQSNNVRKMLLVFYKSSSATGYAQHSGVTMTSTLGVPMTRAGSITGVSWYSPSDTIGANATASHGTYNFAIGDRITVSQTSGTAIYTKINDTNKLSVSDTSFTSGFITVEIEFTN